MPKQLHEDHIRMKDDRAKNTSKESEMMKWSDNSVSEKEKESKRVKTAENEVLKIG